MTSPLRHHRTMEEWRQNARVLNQWQRQSLHVDSPTQTASMLLMDIIRDRNTMTSWPRVLWMTADDVDNISRRIQWSLQWKQHRWTAVSSSGAHVSVPRRVPSQLPCCASWRRSWQLSGFAVPLVRQHRGNNCLPLQPHRSQQLTANTLLLAPAWITASHCKHTATCTSIDHNNSLQTHCYLHQHWSQQLAANSLLLTPALITTTHCKLLE